TYPFPSNDIYAEIHRLRPAIESAPPGETIQASFSDSGPQVTQYVTSSLEGMYGASWKQSVWYEAFRRQRDQAERLAGSPRYLVSVLNSHYPDKTFAVNVR